MYLDHEGNRKGDISPHECVDSLHFDRGSSVKVKHLFAQEWSNI